LNEKAFQPLERFVTRVLHCFHNKHAIRFRPRTMRTFALRQRVACNK
jgi:hypothetical protein